MLLRKSLNYNDECKTYSVLTKTFISEGKFSVEILIPNIIPMKIKMDFRVTCKISGYIW